VTAEPVFAVRSVPHYHGAAMDGIFRRDFYVSEPGQAMLAAIRSDDFRAAVARLGGYHTERTGTIKLDANAPVRAAHARAATPARKRAAARRRSG